MMRMRKVPFEAATMIFCVFKVLTILCFMLANVSFTHAQKARLLTSYLPASMQALAYYIDQLQYEPLSTVTIEPPFNANGTVNETLYSTNTQRNSTTKRPQITWSVPGWWLPSTTTATTLLASRKPLTAATSAITSTKRPTNVWQAPSWWLPATTSTTKKTTTTSTTKAPTSMPSASRKPLTTASSTITSTKRPSYVWQAPSWWVSADSTTTTTTRKTTTMTTTKKTTKMTKAPTSILSVSSVGWWKPPSWWQNPLNVNATTVATPTTRAHMPGIYAPTNEDTRRVPEGYEIFCEFGDHDLETLAKLPAELIHDIRTEADHDQFTNDVESLDNFLRLYDDKYGRDSFSNIDSVLDRWSSTSTAGKKRIPPNKPYVEFLLVYDLLKRDAKAENLSKYEGYSEDMLKELHELSDASAPRQLYMLFKRMLERRDIQRSDVVQRIQMLVKELGNSQSETAKALQPIPAMQFLL